MDGAEDVGRPSLWRLDALDRRILLIAVPALGSLLVEPIYVLTDTAVVGRLGTVPLGGLALASTVLNTLVWVFNFLSYGTTVRVAVRRGRGDVAGAAADALQALWLALGIGLAVAVVIGLAARPLVNLIGDEAAVIDQGVTYLRISIVGVPFQLLTVASIGYLYGIPDTKRPFIVLALSTLVNLLVELLLVYGFDWGIACSAWGTVVAQVLCAAAMLAIVVPSLRADGLRRLHVVPAVMWAVLKVGGQLVQRTGFLLATLAVATAAASQVGTSELAAHQIAAQLFLFFAIGVDMFKVSGQSLIGHALGAGRPEEARDVVAHLYRWAWRAGILLTVATLALSPVLPLAFTDDTSVRHAATVALVLLAAMQVPAAFTFVLDGVLMGANDFGDLRWSTTLAFLVSLPGFVAVMVWPSLGIATVWLAMLVWITARAVKNHTRTLGDRWLASADTVT
ncbi:MAG: MATE family efflux transporter [Acidimicrobiales bacterium]|nr:MATE family efflux transporter [Acidimicrobiales bacterium]